MPPRQPGALAAAASDYIAARALSKRPMQRSVRSRFRSYTKSPASCSARTDFDPASRNCLLSARSASCTACGAERFRSIRAAERIPYQGRPGQQRGVPGRLIRSESVAARDSRAARHEHRADWSRGSPGDEQTFVARHTGSRRQLEEPIARHPECCDVVRDESLGRRPPDRII